MDDKSNKTGNFFKREGFYVLLFVCICIVATVAAITAKNKADINNAIVDSNEQTNIGDAAVTDQDYKEYQNSIELKKNTAKNTAASTNTKSVAAAATSTDWGKPVVGKLARAFNSDPVYWDSTDSSRPNFGVDIQAALGSKVYSVLDGVVLDVLKDSDGVKVIVDHQNGFKSVYSNLAENITVKKGANIKKAQILGYVGKTTLNSAFEKYGDHLHFQIMKGSSYVDPAKYISKYL
jgi:murein DD-endopeptidase MepM/ murein hydrolase activator NlpD